MIDTRKIKEYSNEELINFVNLFRKEKERWGYSLPSYTEREMVYFLVMDELHQRKNLLYRIWKVTEEIRDFPKMDPTCIFAEGGECYDKDYSDCYRCEFAKEHCEKMKWLL